MGRKGYTRKTYDFRTSVIIALKWLKKHFNDRTEVETVERLIIEREKEIRSKDNVV